MKKIFLIIMLVVLSIPVIVNADSGFDSSYKDTPSTGEALMSAGSTGVSILGELLKSQPGDKDFKTNQIIVSIVCIIIMLIVTSIYVYKLKKNKKVLISILISLILTALFSLLCFLTELPVAVYLVLLILYLIPFITISIIIIKVRLNNRIKKVKELDNNFDKKTSSTEMFNLYNDIQVAWMNFDYSKLKKLVSKEIYDKYKTQLEELKNNNQKNVMENITLKSNKITNIEIKDKVVIECKMNVNCIDYIIDNEEKIIKGKKDKICNYTYKLVFNKELNTNKYTLIEKKMLKQK